MKMAEIEAPATFLAAAVLYFLAIGQVKGFAFTLGLTTILVLRSMSRRFRASATTDDADAPYGPRTPPSRTRESVATP